MPRGVMQEVEFDVVDVMVVVVVEMSVEENRLTSVDWTGRVC